MSMCHNALSTLEEVKPNSDCIMSCATTRSFSPDFGTKVTRSTHLDRSVNRDAFGCELWRGLGEGESQDTVLHRSIYFLILDTLW